MLLSFFFFNEDASMKQDLNALNSEKNSPLHWACLNGHIEVRDSYLVIIDLSSLLLLTTDQ